MDLKQFFELYHYTKQLALIQNRVNKHNKKVAKFIDVNSIKPFVGYESFDDPQLKNALAQYKYISDWEKDPHAILFPSNTRSRKIHYTSIIHELFHSYHHECNEKIVKLNQEIANLQWTILEQIYLIQ